MDKMETLRHYFGHDSFRPGQEAMVDALLAGRDALGIMPTGAGKSMCYQIPALMRPGAAVVISPLISLMKDQVAALKSAGVPAAFINSSLTPRQMDLAMERACQGAYRIIYVAPERLETAAFRRFAQHAPISLIAVDEAHCVSQWGQDFRPNYLKIADFVDSLPARPPVGAFTATATQRVREDIIRLLRLNAPVQTVTGFDRPNLFFEVLTPKSKEATLLALLKERQGQCGIVYCATRKAVEELHQKLLDAGIAAGRYHAGMGDAAREQNQEDFRFDRVQVMVATNAFGMGIDKSNVNYVIHYNMPKSMEAYYQEAGRAGRDGTEAACILLYSPADIMTAKWMIEHGDPNEELTAQEQAAVRRQDLIRLNRMVDYCKTAGCLRQYILRYFGEDAPERCEGCGNCTNARHEALAALPRPSRRAVRPTRPASADAPLEEPVSPDDLFGQLRACRMALARSLRVPPYIICTDKTLEDMASRKPLGLNEMLQVRGMGAAKVGKYGSAFLRVIRSYAAAHPAGRSVAAGHTVTAKRAATAKQASAASTKSPHPWTKEEDERLRRGYLAGVSIAQLSAIHERTESAIRERLRLLGLTL